MHEVYMPHQMTQKHETEVELAKDMQRQQNSQAYLDQIKKTQNERNANYTQTLQMQIQQHELQKQQEVYEKKQLQNVIKERAAVVRSFE